MDDAPELVDVDPLLLAGLRRTLETQGSDAFVARPIVRPDRACFPDGWTPTPLGVHRVARRVLMHLESSQLRVRVSDGRTTPGKAPGGTVSLVAVREDEVELHIEAMTTRRVLLPQLCVELSRALLVRAQGAVASSPSELPGDRAAALALIAAGFGSITLLGSAAEGRIAGLTTEGCTTLLAVQLVVRDRGEADTVAESLGTRLRGQLLDVVDTLAEQRDALRTALGLPDAESWPEPGSLPDGPLPDDTDGEAIAVALQEAFEQWKASPDVQPTARGVPRAHGGVGAAVGLAVGLGTMIASGAVAPLWLGPALGFVIGQFFVVRTVCSACGTPLPDAERCPGCGASLRGPEVSPEPAVEPPAEAEAEALPSEPPASGD